MSEIGDITYGRTGSGFEKKILEEGTPYQAKVEKIEPRERNKFGEPGVKEDVLMVTFEVTQEGEYKGEWASGFAKKSIHPKSTLIKWLKPFYKNLDPEEGFKVKVHPEDVIGMPCMIITKPSKNGKYSNIESVVRSPEATLLEAEFIAVPQAETAVVAADVGSDDVPF